MLFLWVFGDNVEDSMGHSRFISFYLINIMNLILRPHENLSDPTWSVIWSIMILLIGVSYITNENNADVLLAGYNTMSKKEKESF